MLDPAGVLYWPAAGLLAVSDLHLEKGSSFARRGMLLPPFDTKATLDRLVALIRHWGPRIVVALGDSFHDREAAARLTHEQAQRVRAMTAGRRFVWVRGNHDPEPPGGLGGECVEAFTLGPLTFRHQAERGAVGEVCGHFHPKAAVPARGGQVSRPCFVTDARRIMMPAFGCLHRRAGCFGPGDRALIPPRRAGVSDRPRAAVQFRSGGGVRDAGRMVSDSDDPQGQCRWLARNDGDPGRRVRG